MSLAMTRNVFGVEVTSILTHSIQHDIEIYFRGQQKPRQNLATKDSAADMTEYAITYSGPELMPQNPSPRDHMSNNDRFTDSQL